MVDRRGSDGDTRLWGYAARADFLARQNVSLSLLANRRESVVSREFAGRSDVLTEHRSATLTARRLWVPSTLTLRQEIVTDESVVGEQVSRRADRRRIARYEGRRGWEDGEMELRYEFVDDTDEVFPRLSYRNHEAHVSSGADFGEESNWHWDSRLRYTTRTGLVESTAWTVDESLRADHTATLSSDYRYSFARTESGATEVTTQSAAANLRHRLWGSLATAAGVNGVRQTLADGERDTGRGRLDLGYSKRLPLGGRLTAAVGGSLQYDDNRFRSSETSVLRETHTVATPIALPLALRNPFVVLSSIAVTKIDRVAVPAGCLLPALPASLTAGVDFDVRLSGDIAEIVPRACTAATPGMNPGDTIAVDYRFRVAPSITFTTATWHGDVAVDYRWVRLFASHEQSQQDLVAGRRNQFLQDQRSAAVGAELRFEYGRAGGNVTAEARRFDSTRTRHESLRTGAVVHLAVLEDLQLTLSGDRVVTRFPAEHRETETRTGRGDLVWIIGDGLTVAAGGGMQQIEDTSQRPQRSVNARLLVRWLFRDIEVTPTVEYFDRRSGETTSAEYRANLRVVRRF